MKIQGEDCHWSEMFRPHPTYLFVKKTVPPCAEPAINSDGFRGPLAPLIKDPRVFTILFGGGSVAEDLLGGLPITTLETELNRKFKVPGYDKIQVISTAMAAWRQPQTFIAFSLNSHRIDAYATLDGFNEYYLIEETPVGNLFGSIGNPFVLRGETTISGIKGALAAFLDGSLLKWMRNDGILQKSHAIYFFVNRLRNKFREIHLSTNRNIEGQNSVIAPEPGVTKEQVFRYNIDRYLHTLRQTDAIAKRFQIRVLHFIQPVPAEKKSLTERETALVGDLTYVNFYRAFAQELLLLNKEDINVISLHDLFKDTAEELFRDRIHLNDNGNEILLERIVTEIVQKWQLQRK